jgi:hypothetical protein
MGYAMQFNDVATRRRTRFSFSYGLIPRIPDAAPSESIDQVYSFGRLSGHIQAARDLLPRVIFNREITPAQAPAVNGQRISSFPALHSMRILVAVTARGGAVMVIDGEAARPVHPDRISSLLAATCFDRDKLRIYDQPILTWLVAQLADAGIALNSLDFGSDVHQCVFSGGSLADELCRQTDSGTTTKLTGQILSRGTVPADSTALLGIRMAASLNNAGSTFVAHGRGVSLFAGWTPQMENGFLLTAISTVSALEALRVSRHEAFEAMALAQDPELASPRRARGLVTELSDKLNEMQLDLSFGVETNIDSTLIPEMVIEGFQRSLSEAVGIRESLENTSRMLERVSTVIAARQAKLEEDERERVEGRDRLIAVLVALASFLALPPALLLAFFGINASQVHSSNSIFDWRYYWPAYILAWLPFLVLVTVGGFMYARIRNRRSSLYNAARG